MNNEKAAFILPEIQYWSAEQLNAIIATMSGGGGGIGGGVSGGGSSGGGTGGGAGDSGSSGGTGGRDTYLEWDSSPREFSTSNHFESWAVGEVTGVVTGTILSGLGIAGAAAVLIGVGVSYVVFQITDSCMEDVYYKTYEWYLKEMLNNPAYAGMGMIVGHVRVSLAFEDKNHHFQIGEPIAAYSLSSSVSESELYNCPAWSRWPSLSSLI